MHHQHNTNTISDHQIPAITTNATMSITLNIPSTPETATLRILKNLSRFNLLYALFTWIVLAIALIPARKDSLLLLSIIGNFTLLYMLLLRSFPDSVILQRIIDKRIVAALVATVTIVLMIVSDAGKHLIIVVFSCVPVILLHAVLVVNEREIGGFYCKIEGGSLGIKDDQVLVDDKSSTLDSV